MYTDLNNDIKELNDKIEKYNTLAGNIYFYYGKYLYKFNDYMHPLEYINPRVFVPEGGGSKKTKSRNKSKRTTKPKIKKFVLGIERLVSKDPVTKKEMITYNRAPMFLSDARKLDSQKKSEKRQKNKKASQSTS